MTARMQAVVCAVFLLFSCGGGSGGAGGTQAGSASPPPMDGGNNPPQDNNGVPPPAPGDTESGAALMSAPPDGATVTHIVRLEIEGSGIANAELLPAAGGSPYALFNVAADGKHAWVDFDSRTIPNSERTVYIEAYDMPRGAPGARAIMVMPPRTWVIRNDAVLSPFPGIYPEERDTGALEDMLAMDDAGFETMMTVEWPRVHALLQAYIPDNVEFLPPQPNGFVGAKNACTFSTDRGNRLACREYMAGIVGLARR